MKLEHPEKFNDPLASRALGHVTLMPFTHRQASASYCLMGHAAHISGIDQGVRGKYRVSQIARELGLSEYEAMSIYCTTDLGIFGNINAQCKLREMRRQHRSWKRAARKWLKAEARWLKNHPIVEEPQMCPDHPEDQMEPVLELRDRFAGMVMADEREEVLV